MSAETKREQAAMASGPATPLIALTQDQMTQLLTAVRDFGASSFETRHRLSDTQKNAERLFEKAAAGMCISKFKQFAAPLQRSDPGKLCVPAKTAAHAVIYAEHGVVETKVQDQELLLDQRLGRIHRIDIFDNKKVLVYVAGAEQDEHRALVTTN